MATAKKPLGSFVSINASVMPVFLDAKLLDAWEPLDPDSDGDDIGGHPQKIIDLLDDDEDFTHATLKVGKGAAAVVSLEGQTGEAEVYRVEDTLLVVEPPRSWWDDEDNYGKKAKHVEALFTEALTSAPSGKAVAKVAVPSGKLVLFDSNADLEDAAKVVAKTKSAKAFDVKPFGDDDGGLIVTLEPGDYSIVRKVFEPKWAKDQPLVVAYVTKK